MQNLIRILKSSTRLVQKQYLAGLWRYFPLAPRIDGNDILLGDDAAAIKSGDGYLLLAAEGEWSRGELPAGRFTAKVLAGRLEVNFTPNLGWSNLVQYDSDSRELGFQSRLRWRVRPGSDVFVVLNRGWVHGEDGVYRPYFDRGSAKVQHTFRW